MKTVEDPVAEEQVSVDAREGSAMPNTTAKARKSNPLDKTVLNLSRQFRCFSNVNTSTYYYFVWGITSKKMALLIAKPLLIRYLGGMK